jgi:hypothetical protein
LTAALAPARPLAKAHGLPVGLHRDALDTILFALGLFDQVAALVKPRRRRHQDPAAADRLAAYRYVSCTSPRW